jgi:adenylate cyclase
MQDNNETEEIKQLKREIAKLRLEGNLRKSLSNQLTIQKKIADDAKAEALTKSEEVAKISNQLAKYLSPQIHEQIFSGKQSAEVKSNRKKLTVFFSDIVNFTDISDELESEEMTNLLNFYLNEMSQIALKFGGTIDKFIGDALMIFFGDPESKGPQEDAKQCIQMALEMQDLMTQLSDYWSKNYSLKKELKIRIGINTGFCTVGNFGSLDRIDYTAIGSTVNLASRLESMSDPGSILVSEDTFALVNNFFSFENPKEVKVKGFLRSIKCYKLQKEDTSKEDIFSISGKGFQISINKKLIHKSIISDLKNKLDNLISEVKD